MEKGELVRTCVMRGLQGALEYEWGSVIDYRPAVLGGSTHISTGILTSPIRGEVLVLSYKDGGMSWYDEKNVDLVRDPL